MGGPQGDPRASWDPRSPGVRSHMFLITCCHSLLSFAGTVQKNVSAGRGGERDHYLLTEVGGGHFLSCLQTLYSSFSTNITCRSNSMCLFCHILNFGQTQRGLEASKTLDIVVEPKISSDLMCFCLRSKLCGHAQIWT